MHCAVSADIVGTNEVLTVLYIPISKVGTVEQLDNLPFAALESNLELVRYRFFKSVSVFGFLVGFSKVGIGFGIGFLKNIAISVSVFGFSARTYRCLSNDTIADTLRPPLSPEWGLGPRITNCGHKR